MKEIICETAEEYRQNLLEHSGAENVYVADDAENGMTGLIFHSGEEIVWVKKRVTDNA